MKYRATYHCPVRAFVFGFLKIVSFPQPLGNRTQSKSYYASVSDWTLSVETPVHFQYCAKVAKPIIKLLSPSSLHAGYRNLKRYFWVSRSSCMFDKLWCMTTLPKFMAQWQRGQGTAAAVTKTSNVKNRCYLTCGQLIFLDNGPYTFATEGHDAVQIFSTNNLAPKIGCNTGSMIRLW